MEMIAPELPLREKVVRALLGIPVRERCLLDWIECHEMGVSARCRTIAMHQGLDESKLMRAYVDSLACDRTEMMLVA